MFDCRLPKLPVSSTNSTCCTQTSLQVLYPFKPSHWFWPCVGSCHCSFINCGFYQGCSDGLLQTCTVQQHATTTRSTCTDYSQVMRLPVILSGSHSRLNCFVCSGLSTILDIPCHVDSWRLSKYLTGCFSVQLWKEVEAESCGWSLSQQWFKKTQNPLCLSVLMLFQCFCVDFCQISHQFPPGPPTSKYRSHG